MTDLLKEIKEILTKYSNENEVEINEIEVSPKTTIKDSKLRYSYKIGIKFVK